MSIIFSNFIEVLLTKYIKSKNDGWHTYTPWNDYNKLLTQLSPYTVNTWEGVGDSHKHTYLLCSMIESWNYSFYASIKSPVFIHFMTISLYGLSKIEQNITFPLKTFLLLKNSASSQCCIIEAKAAWNFIKATQLSTESPCWDALLVCELSISKTEPHFLLVLKLPNQNFILIVLEADSRKALFPYTSSLFTFKWLPRSQLYLLPMS